jgi:predicted site-specific integrase-resolvase
MVENDHLSSKEVCELLGINHNNLHQIQYRGSIKWVKREGRKVYYDRASVLAYQEKRANRRKKSE